jgi:MFS family permease
MVLYFLVAYGAVTWFPPYMSRVLGMPLEQIGAVYGLIAAVAALFGTVVGGILTDRLARRDRRWLARWPALILILCCPIYEIGLATDSATIFFIAAFTGGFGLSASVPAMFTFLHAVCGSARRSMAVAVTYFFANLLGLGFGPLITGALSDSFSATAGPDGLRWALMLSIAILVPCGITLALAAKALEQDMEA